MDVIHVGFQYVSVGSSTVNFIIKDQRLLVRFCGQKDSLQRKFFRKCFQLTVGSVCHLKQFSLCGKLLTDDEKVANILHFCWTCSLKWIQILSI
jgi:hypothetical protein